MRYYNFHGLFSLRTNISYFDGLLHSFRGDRDGDGKLKLSFQLDNALSCSTGGKPSVNLMFYHNKEDNSIEFNYPWIRPIIAKLRFDTDYVRYDFSFNKSYQRFSRVVAEGWELIDIFRSLLQISLIERGMYMVHGAAADFAGEGILIPSFGNTGKTTTTWMLAKRGARFVTDEFAILDPDGTCFGFPCSSLVSAGLVKMAGLKLSKGQHLSLKLRNMRSKLLTTRFAPGGLRMYPDENLRTCKRTLITRLGFIQNGLDGLRKIDRDEAYTMLRAIQDYELNWRANPFVIARSFFQPEFNASAISAIEEKFMKSLVSRTRGTYLVSSSNGTHYQIFETIQKEIPTGGNA